MRKTAANALGKIIKIINFCTNLIILAKIVAKTERVGWGDFRENKNIWTIFAKTKFFPKEAQIRNSKMKKWISWFQP